MHHFGRGLVNTPVTLASWVNVRRIQNCWIGWRWELVRNNWDLKQLQRTLLTSRAYRQSSQRTDALAAVDPDNRLLGRMSIRRLEAEAIRDAMIDVAGMRVSAMYGPSLRSIPTMSAR